MGFAAAEGPSDEGAVDDGSCRAGSPFDWSLHGALPGAAAWRVFGLTSIDAAFKAIERATNVEMGLLRYRVRSVSVGEDAQGEVTVDVVHDGRTRRGRGVATDIVEASALAFLSVINGITGNTLDFWPQDLRADIEPVNDRIYDTFNNGVYKSGFATTQDAYDSAVHPLFDTLDWLEDRLSTSRYLMGDRVTEADWRLFPTLVRFDPVYHLHFKCNRRRIIDYPNLWGYTRELYQWPGVAETVNMTHIVRHYHFSHESINPHRIVPINPDIDFMEPHGRGDQRATA